MKASHHVQHKVTDLQRSVLLLSSGSTSQRRMLVSEDGAVSSCRTSVTTYQSTWHSIQEYLDSDHYYVIME